MRRLTISTIRTFELSSALVSGLLAFGAGFADAASFVGADGIFCGHVTGNFVVLAAQVARGTSRDQLLKLASFPLFVVTVLAATRVSPRRSRGVAALLGVSSLLLGLAALIGPLSQAGRHLPPGLPRASIVALLVIAMGVQNALHRLHPELGPPTTAMTGNVTSFLVALATPGAPDGRAGRRALGFTLMGFTLGCLAGAFAVQHFGFVALVVPAFVSLGVRLTLRSPAMAVRQ